MEERIIIGEMNGVEFSESLKSAKSVKRNGIQKLKTKDIKHLLSKENLEYLKSKNITLTKALNNYKKGARLGSKENYLAVDEYYTRFIADEKERKYFNSL